MFSSQNVVKPGELIVVAGGTGYVGAAICRHLLQRGYRVRATARSLARAQPVIKLFHRDFPVEQFEVVSVPDWAVEGAYDSALEGASGFIVVAGDTTGNPDIASVIDKTVAAMRHVLDSASRTKTLKRVVMTSSRDAVFYGEEDAEYDVDSSVWNEWVVKKAYEAPMDDPLKGMYGYSAGKVKGEQAAFAYVKENKPHFVFNTVLPELVFGPVLNESTASTGAMMNKLYEGRVDQALLCVAHFPYRHPRAPYRDLMHNPTYFVHMDDVARIHEAALIEPDVQNERLWAASAPATVNDCLAVFRKRFPDRKWPPDETRAVYSKTTRIRINLDRSRELLARQGREDWIGLEETLLENVRGVA